MSAGLLSEHQLASLGVISGKPISGIIWVLAFSFLLAKLGFWLALGEVGDARGAREVWNGTCKGLKTSGLGFWFPGVTVGLV